MSSSFPSYPSEPLICLCDYNLAELECERSANNTCTISSGRCVATFHLLGDAVSEEYSCYDIDQLREQNGICEGHFNNNNRVNLCCDDENLCNERFRLQNPFTTPTPGETHTCTHSHARAHPPTHPHTHTHSHQKQPLLTLYYA